MHNPIDSEADDSNFSMFDSYCKTVLTNETQDIKRKHRNRGKKEVIIEENTHQYTSHSTYTDWYPEERLIIYADTDTFSCVVNSETLYIALLTLPDRQRTGIILKFWYGWLDENIAKYMGVTVRTVYNLRQRAFTTIRIIYEKRHQEK